MFVSLMELCAFILVLYVIIFQIIIPAMRGTKLFPVIRRSAKLEKTITDLNQKVEEKEIETEIKNLKKEKGVK